MKAIIFKAENRGKADYGWLKANYSFSFANYHNPEKVHFGVLRVLNDDTIASGMGFDTHPHDNMEIITIPLSGQLGHKDSMGNESVISAGEVQVMSAGTGIFHSEFNKNADEELKLFQIWLFPNKKNVEPRYDQISLSDVEKKNELYQILSPNANDQGVWIYQNAWFHMGKFDAGKGQQYALKDSSNGIYLMVIDGKLNVNGYDLNQRDAIGVSNVDGIEMKAISNTHFLLMEVPMAINN